MNEKEKQIEEMPRYIDANELYKKIFTLDVVDKRRYSINAKAVADAIVDMPTADVVPRAELAREIFEEIERETKNHGITYTQRKIAELKKKYTEPEPPKESKR